MKERLASDLSKLVEAMAKISEIVGILLFGSFVRGNYDEYSDYDLLILFRDRKSMWRRWDELFKVGGEFDMNLHLIPKALDELREGSPVFLNEVFEHGKILYAKLPLEVFAVQANLKPFCMIFYEMRGLSHGDKMKALYYLYGKKGEGAVAELKGVKLAEGCVAIPRDAADKLIEKLKAYGVKVRKLDVHLDERSLAPLAIHRKPLGKERKTRL